MATNEPESPEALARQAEEDGFVILKNMIPEEKATLFAGLVASAPRGTPEQGWEARTGLLDHDVTFAELVTHPTVLAIVRELIGGRTKPVPNAHAWPVEDQVRLDCCDALVAHPGSESGWWHLDSPMAQLNPSRPVPDFPITVNVIWMATSFSRANGATRVMPRSHLLRRVPDASRESLPGEFHLCGDPGDVGIIPNTTWHAASPNQTNDDRIGVACYYVPWWVSCTNPDITPIRLSSFERLPEAAQVLIQHQLQWHVPKD